MKDKKQLMYDKIILKEPEQQYNQVKNLTISIRDQTTDLNFEEHIPDSQERCLMVDELQAYDYIRTSLMNRIRFYRNRIKANKPEPWEEPDNGINDWSKYEKTNRYKTGVDVSSEGDHSACCQVCGDNITAQHHCGQDAKEEAHVSLNELLGMQVVSVGGSKTRCVGCPQETDSCFKVELVGGDHICLAKPEQDKRPVISFDEENEEGLGDIMARIKEDTEAFMDYLNRVVGKKNAGHDKEL